ncbi:MAG TPA: hypothetical protein VFG68_04660 [Fimbriiglobus sp.]|nr:hypothetical protein [Fimbriiglobus sp.]
MASAQAILDTLRTQLDTTEYKKLHWEGTFDEYLGIILDAPGVARTAYQRLYDMILSHGIEEVYENKEKHIRFKFFTEFASRHSDGIYGLDRPLSQLVNTFKSAALGYGTERRVILLHGPVGSAKSTIARLLKRGLEEYSRTDAGMVFSFGWKNGDGTYAKDPMHGEPLQLVPEDYRHHILAMLNDQSKKPHPYEIVIKGDLCPFSRYEYAQRLSKYNGDWMEMLRNEVRVYRLILSEKDRVGIGTFQPKDEKNQDSTELTGDINYRKIAEYGSDSDPRAFNFDGELNIANRGIIEFIEVLKLDVAFLYDLLGASQEHKIKPKKFAQTDIDEVILGHSVAGVTPIPYRFDGRAGWATLEGLHERFADDPTGLEVLAHDFASGRTDWTPVRRVFRHQFTGRMLTTSQKWGAVETTPNHSVYGRDGRAFYPDERKEVMAVRALDTVFADPLATVDLVEDIPGFVRDEACVTAAGGVMTRPCPPGWARLDRPRHATTVRAVYDPVVDVQPLKDLITVLVWYATEGHVNGTKGVVISQANPAELERVRRAYARITTGGGSIDAGAKTDSAWRLYLSARAIGEIAVHHCGRRSVNKRLPDFLFRLPSAYLRHTFDELMRTDGSRKLSAELDRTASAAYRAAFFEYKTISPVLAAQVGTLATLLGYDYSVYRAERSGKPPAYRVRFVSGTGKRGGRHTSYQARLHERPAREEWVYDIEDVAGLHNFVCGVGNVVCSNTNEPEYRRLQNNEFMEALRDRTVKIDIPYVTRLREEVKIYEKDFNVEKVRGKHIAPHTVEVAAMWAVLTRLAPPKHASLTLLQKLKLYNGKTLPGFTEDNVIELKRESPAEGMAGISPRYIQDKISNALVAHPDEDNINPFMVMKELEDGLRHHALLKDEEQFRYFKELLAVVREEYEDIVKNEVQRAIAADEEALARLCGNYIDNVKAYTQREKVRNRFTGAYEEPDERLMRSVEEKIDIPEGRKDDFRREIMNYIGALAVDGKKFDYKTNERLQKALELKLFEDQKDTIKLTSLVSNVVDRATQEKIDVVKSRLIRNYGYNEASATDVLNFVASIFARGQTKK